MRPTGLTRERAPLFIQVRKAGDLSFLPLNRATAHLDYSAFRRRRRAHARNANEISAYLFSDRGLYRPGDTIHIGMITRRRTGRKISRAYRWNPRCSTRAGSPSSANASNCRQAVAELLYATADTAPTGTTPSICTS